MKKLVLFAVVVAGVAFSACKKEAPVVDQEVQGMEETVTAAGDSIVAAGDSIVVEATEAVQ